MPSDRCILKELDLGEADVGSLHVADHEEPVLRHSFGALQRREAGVQDNATAGAEPGLHAAQRFSWVSTILRHKLFRLHQHFSLIGLDENHSSCVAVGSGVTLATYGSRLPLDNH